MGRPVLGTAVNRTGFVGNYSSLAIGTDGNPVISYEDATNTSLKVARCNDAGCTGQNETLSTVDDIAGAYTSIVIGTGGNPIVSYNGASHLLVARCNDPACAGHNEALSTADRAANVGQETTIALGLDGGPVIAHWDGDNGDLRVTRPAIP